MLTEETAYEMMKHMDLLKKNLEKRNSKKNRKLLIEYEAECIEKLKYFVQMRAGKYRNFANYEDLIQEGMDALLKAIRTFEIKKKGSFFFWAGLFVNTRLVRSANNHSVIRYPMYVAKKNKPHKETRIPIMLDPAFSPERMAENAEISSIVRGALDHLDDEQKEVIKMIYGIGENKFPNSITKTCKEKKISRTNCLKTLNGALEILKDKIEI